MHHDESLFAYYGYWLFRGNGYDYQPILHGPVLQFVSAFFFLLFGDDQWTMRLPSLIGGLLMLPHFVWPDRHAWLLLLGYGLMQGLAGVLLMLATLLAPANRIAPTQYSQMLWAIGFGYWLFGDRLDWPMLVGIALILGAGLFTLVREGQVTPWWRRQKLV